MGQLIWRIPFTQQEYTGASPGFLLKIKCDHCSQTAQKCLSFNSGKKIHTTCKNNVTIQLHQITYWVAYDFLGWGLKVRAPYYCSFLVVSKLLELIWHMSDISGIMSSICHRKKSDRKASEASSISEDQQSRFATAKGALASKRSSSSEYIPSETTTPDSTTSGSFVLDNGSYTENGSYNSLSNHDAKTPDSSSQIIVEEVKEKDTARGGRVRSTTPAEDRYIVLSAKRNRRTTAQQVANQFLAASGKQISRKTVARRLRGGGLYARRPVVCVPLTRQHRTARLQWCREHHNWTEQDWACVLFSDESRFSLSSDCRRQLIWRESGTAYSPENIQEKDRYPTCSIMVWARIMINGRTRLHVVANGTMTGQRYIDEVLLPSCSSFPWCCR
ncbi:hypothetical protein TNCV_4739981 [Trichonephila clavipes]|nr:hypothetical protein TNCV_4739981 [Trichonephila clavipes]